jgi:hypothetical protein
MEHGAWSSEQGVRSQNPEFRRKTIKSGFFSTTGYRLLDSMNLPYALRPAPCTVLHLGESNRENNKSRNKQKHSHPGGPVDQAATAANVLGANLFTAIP